MRLSTSLLGLLLAVAPAVLAQTDLPNLSTVGQPDGKGTTSASAKETSQATQSAGSSATAQVSSAPSSQAASKSDSGPSSSVSAFRLPDAPTIAGYGIPAVQVPDTAAAPFMQKSNLPDGTVFICVGAALGFFGASILAWRALVAWSLHRSVKRAAQAQNLADIKAMSSVPGKKRGMYNVVGASSNMSLDHLSAAPPGTSRAQKPFASNPNTNTPPKSTSSLFFSPTAGGATGLRDSVVNRSSNYLPAGYYAAGNSQPAQGSPVMHVGGHNSHPSTHSLITPGNRYSTRSGISPPGSPSIPPSSRGYDRAPPSRDGISMYNRNSVATLGTPRGIYAHEQGNPSQLSLNVPGGTTVAGGRAPSTYLEDLFENHGNGPRERF
ncbi:hypothetical protein K505DRAFT_247667 [Melanomma pulvis-pyrius CBS 109.77]|uniref:Csi2 protein n=1 Tax=Melanomma pulvis-pyrius CBS 109.77 TaxID=1314802 RepID=A0A6A6X7C7_9PLEO|nr:hypothetical protein K505DRAFT_247667 [Melanomma pulvis-pyrius CBS 109.77]